MLTKEDCLKLKSMSIDELYTKRDGLKKELMDFRFQHSSGQLVTPHMMKQVKHDIARVETEISVKQKKENA